MINPLDRSTGRVPGAGLHFLWNAAFSELQKKPIPQKTPDMDSAANHHMHSEVSGTDFVQKPYLEKDRKRLLVGKQWLPRSLLPL